MTAPSRKRFTPEESAAYTAELRARKARPQPDDPLFGARKPAAPPALKRRGHPGTSPWESLPSLRAGLPRDREEWLALMLPIIDRCQTHPEVVDELKKLGHDLGASGTKTSSLWHQRIDAYRVAGALPEHPHALPERRAGWREGAPLPTAEDAREGGRKGSEARWGKGKGKARKGPGKGGKGKAKP